MFRHRRTSQKPSDELYKNFKADFPHLVSQNHDHAVTSPPHSQPASSLSDALDVTLTAGSIEQSSQDINKDADPTPRLSHEAWNFGSSTFTPSVMDPDSHSFNMFASQMPGYYTPTPGGTNTLYHSQAGDLHTPGLGMGMGTPLSMPTSENALHAGQQTFHGFPTHLSQHLPPQQFQNVNPFHMHTSHAFPPQQFTHQTSFDHMEGPAGESPIDDIGIELGMASSHHHTQSPDLMYPSHQLRQETVKPASRHPAGEQYVDWIRLITPSLLTSDSFRFHVTLNAPTAMVKQSDEIPITYLNKGQAYILNVVDTQNQHSTRYRTFVRVSFEDEQQRQKPAACWQLWKEGRGTNEAHQRGGRLQAVEYVDSAQQGHVEDPSKPKIELQEASFDGFCVIWSPPPGVTECAISVRFNFLSTDFSHSKGVKGIPVRLCAKTEALDDLTPTHTAQSPNSEVCYCKVKLFRDHGAERKLSNDVAHVKKTIDKLNQQISQIEQGLKDFGKRKRSGSVVKNSMDNRPSKVLKHRRTWSMTSATSGGARGSAEDDLHVKLRMLQDMFTSTRPASVLYLTGDAEDDPDTNPVKLSGGDASDLMPIESVDPSGWERRSATGGESGSPTSSSNSLVGSRRDSTLQQPTPFGEISRSNSNEWRKHPQTAIMDFQPSIPEGDAVSPVRRTPTKVQTATRVGSIEALGVDPNYQPPPERPIKPVACVFILPSVAGRSPPDQFYRAVYLMGKTLKDFVYALARKCDIEPTSVFRTYRVFQEETLVLFDDDCVRELPEGQAMSIEFCEVRLESPTRVKREWNPAAADIQCDGDISVVETLSSTGYELKLVF